MLFFLLAVFFLLLLSAYFSAAETSLFSLPPATVKNFGSSGNKAQKLVSALLMRPRELLVTLFICNIVTNILTQNLFSHHAGEESSWWMRVAMPLALTLLIGEILPKSLAYSNSAKIAPFIAPSISRAKRFLRPLRFVLTYAAGWASKVLFFFLKKEEEISGQQLQDVLRSSLKTGVLAREEADLIDGYLKLQDTTIKELMRPREDILFYDIQSPLSALIYLFVDDACTRVPVCDGDLEQIKGIITARNFLLHRHVINAPHDLLDLLKKPLFTPEATPAKHLLRQFAARNETIAIVVDEYGSISGLISREDLSEAVVGEITDRRDEKARYTRSGEDVIIASGKMEISELEELFSIHLNNPHNRVTIGGWLSDVTGDIPKAGTHATIAGLYFQVLAADPNRVRRLYIRKTGEEKKR